MPTGFERRSSTHLGVRRDVYVRGEGPGVLVMHEVPGITPTVAEAGRRIADAGFTVWMPDLFGEVDRPFSLPYSFAQLGRACVAKEFHCLARDHASPITEWLCALGRELQESRGQEGAAIGAVGMCLTGGFALALMVDPWVRAPVLSQPSLPFPVSPAHARALHVSPEDLVTIRRRATEEGVPVLGMRFSHDAMCPRARFERLRAELGDGFEAIEIDSGPGNPHGLPPIAHSVISHDFRDVEGHPTRAAFDRMIAFFREQLGR